MDANDRKPDSDGSGGATGSGGAGVHAPTPKPDRVEGGGGGSGALYRRGAAGDDPDAIKLLKVGHGFVAEGAEMAGAMIASVHGLAPSLPTTPPDPGLAPSGGAGGGEGSGARTNAAGAAPASLPGAGQGDESAGAGSGGSGALLHSSAPGARVEHLSDETLDTVNAFNPLFPLFLGAYKTEQGIENNDPEGVGAGLFDVGLGLAQSAAIARGGLGSATAVDAADTTAGSAAALAEGKGSAPAPYVSANELAEVRIRDAHAPGADLAREKSLGVDATRGTTDVWTQTVREGLPHVVLTRDGGEWIQIKIMERPDAANMLRNVEHAMKKFEKRLANPADTIRQDSEGATTMQLVLQRPQELHIILEIPDMTPEIKAEFAELAQKMAKAYDDRVGNLPTRVDIVDAPVNHSGGDDGGICLDPSGVGSVSAAAMSVHHTVQPHEDAPASMPRDSSSNGNVCLDPSQSENASHDVSGHDAAQTHDPAPEATSSTSGGDQNVCLDTSSTSDQVSSPPSVHDAVQTHEDAPAGQQGNQDADAPGTANAP